MSSAKNRQAKVEEAKQVVQEDCKLEVIVPRLILKSGEASKGTIINGKDLRILVSDALRLKLVKVI